MASDHRARIPVAYPEAPVGTCKHCGRHCAPGRRTHDDCAERQAAANDYRAAAERREGAKQRCVDCGLVEGQTRRGPGDFPGGWKWERVKITRDHPRELVDNGPRDWTVARCVQCHQKKTERERKARAMRQGTPVKVKAQPKPSEGGNGARLLLGLLLVVVGGLWLLVQPGERPRPWRRARRAVRGWWADATPSTDVAVLALVLVAVLLVWGLAWGAWWRRRAAARAEALVRLGDAIARETNTDPTRVALTVKRWRGDLPVEAACRYSSLFDDSPGSRGRATVEALVARKVGEDGLTFTWHPARDTVTWSTGGRAVEPEPVAEAPSAPAPPTREAVVDRLGAGLTAALGTHVDVDVTAWHARNVPQSFRVPFPASARVHEDKIQDAVEDKVRTLLPGTWRAEWRTTDDEVVFTDRPDPLAPIVNAPLLPETTNLAALPMGVRDDGGVWTVRLTQTHVLVAGASGAGKGSVLWSLIRAVTPAVAADTVRLWAVDPKGGMELGRGRGVFEKFATDLDDAQELLDLAVRFMQKRAKRLAADGLRIHTPTPGDPMLVLVIDEIATLTKYGAVTKAARDAINGALGLLLSQGRAAGVCVVGALQDPRKDVLTLRDLFPTRIALRVNEPTACDMVLGAGARAAGARADRIAVEHAGVGYEMVDGSPTPTRFRAAWISDEAIDELVALCSKREPRQIEAAPVPAGERESRSPRGTRERRDVTVGLDDLDEGTRILVDVDGEKREVTVMAPPVESADDPDVFEVDWREDDGRVGMLAVPDGTRFTLVPER